MASSTLALLVDVDNEGDVAASRRVVVSVRAENIVSVRDRDKYAIVRDDHSTG